MNTSVNTPFSSQLDQLAILDPTSAEAIALICVILVQHSESLDQLDRRDLQIFIDVVDKVSSEEIGSIYADVDHERRRSPR
jgi:hypothetical protein